LPIFYEVGQEELCSSVLDALQLSKKNVSLGFRFTLHFLLMAKCPLVVLRWFVRLGPLAFLVAVGRVVGNSRE